MSRSTLARVVVMTGFVMLSLGAAFCWGSAVGVMVGGAATVVTGLFLVDVEDVLEPRTARPIQPPG